MTQLRNSEVELEQLGIKVKIVTFDGDTMAQMYIKKLDLSWPLLLDKESEIYKKFSMSRANWWALYNPLSILKYLALIFTGTMPGKPGKDLSQLGGDVLVDPEGVIRMHYLSKNPHDRPSVESILKIVRGK